MAKTIFAAALGLSCAILYFAFAAPKSPLAASEKPERPASEAADAKADRPAAEIEPWIRERLLEIAGEYQKFDPAVEGFNWAPDLCRPPDGPVVPQPALLASESGDRTTHGRKLYKLRVKDKAAYLEAAKRAAPVGQTLVKESFAPEIVPEKEWKPLAPEMRDWLFVAMNGDWHKAGEKRDLFVMFKTEPGTPGTDEGWVYGTVSADGKQVTGGGMVRSCMKCHQEAKFDRQFGLKDRAAADGNSPD